MKRGSINPLSMQELEKLSTPRLLEYLRRLNQCEESPEKSDCSPEEVAKVKGIVFKTSGGWVLQYARVKEVLKGRPHVETK